MKVPLSWLKEYVDIDAPPEDVAEKLTFSGVEVEGIETVGDAYEGLVVGRIVERRPHPNADRLSVCRVHDGEADRTVVCGAENFEAGDKAAFAGVGTVLPGGLKIRKAKIRGVASEGMLCAEDELGLSDDHSGILLFPRHVAEGTPLAEVLGPPETVLDLEITWNRPDCLSMIGIARELAALYGKPLTLPSVEFAESGEPVETLAEVAVDDAGGCPRYTARVLTGVTLKPSPLWMQRRLRLAGVRPISNIVDITNYVMLECGQPLHAFDYAKVAGHRIIVRRARPGETMATLDDVERRLTPDMLLITDDSGPVAVAGVMGGAGSEIADDTAAVLLESACFDPAGIHATSAALGLSTESSHRFERGVDIGRTEWAGRRACALMVDLAGGAAAPGVIDVYPAPPVERRVTCRYRRLNDLLGVAVEPAAIKRILESLELSVVEDDDTSCTIRVPTFRPDLEREADVIEEVARMHGLDKVPAATPRAEIVPDAGDDWLLAQTRCRDHLLGLGLTEIMNYSFLAAPLLDRFGRDETGQRVVLPNPVSAEHSVLRNSLVPQMVETLGHNLAHQNAEFACFEIGRVFEKNRDGAVCESEKLCIGLLGPVGRFRDTGRRPVEPDEMLLWIKGIVEAVCAAQGFAELRFDVSAKPYHEEGWSGTAACGEVVLGHFGLVSAAVRHHWRLAEPIAVAELDFRALSTRRTLVREVAPLSAYPAVNRDVAMIVGTGVRHADVVRVIREAAPAELTDVQLFDIYEGEGIGKGRKSLAYSLTYRSLERSLTDEEANRLHEAIKQALRNKLDADIRET